MAGLVTQVGFIRLGLFMRNSGKPELRAIHALTCGKEGVDARHKAGHDGSDSPRYTRVTSSTIDLR